MENISAVFFLKQIKHLLSAIPHLKKFVDIMVNTLEKLLSDWQQKNNELGLDDIQFVSRRFMK